MIGMKRLFSKVISLSPVYNPLPEHPDRIQWLHRSRVGLETLLAVYDTETPEGHLAQVMTHAVLEDVLQAIRDDKVRLGIINADDK